MAKQIIFVEQLIMDILCAGTGRDIFKTDKAIYYVIGGRFDNRQSISINNDGYFKSYRDGFIAGLNIKENHKVSLLGLEVNELLDIIEKHLIEKKKKLDWSKPLQITTRTGTHDVINLGIGWKNKRLIQIEECSIRFPSHDGSLPNVFNPDENGYVVQFDTYIKNKE